MQASSLSPAQHFVFWLTGGAQEWGQALLKLYADKGEVLVLPAVRAAFLLQYGDVRRHTEEEVRDRLFAGEHNMKSGAVTRARIYPEVSRYYSGRKRYVPGRNDRLVSAQVAFRDAQGMRHGCKWPGLEAA
jgi:hypothetical protein